MVAYLSVNGGASSRRHHVCPPSFLVCRFQPLSNLRLKSAKSLKLRPFAGSSEGVVRMLPVDEGSHNIVLRWNHNYLEGSTTRGEAGKNCVNDWLLRVKILPYFTHETKCDVLA